MKKFIVLIAVAIGMISLGAQQTQAQAWTKESKVLTLGLGGSAYYQLLPGYTYTSYLGPRVYNTWNVNGVLLFQGEFGVHEYVGVGFVTGLAGSAQPASWTSSISAPIGVQANFHFYQLIANKVSKDIHADKLDVYAGVNIGSGGGYDFTHDNVTVPIWGGVQIGARYWFSEKVGVYAEVCPYTGKAFVNGGLSFNL